MRTFYTLYNRRGDALGTVEVGDMEINEAVYTALEWLYEGRKYRYTYNMVVNKGKKGLEFLDVLLKEV